MRKLAALVFALVLVAQARATPVTGDLALAGLNAYNGTSITFHPPVTVLLATGSLSVMSGSTAVTLLNYPTFGAESGNNLFTWTNGTVDVSMLIDTFVVHQNNSNFLNITGTSTLNETGFDATAYDFSMTSTKPDGLTSYTMSITPLPAVPEPASLFLVGTALTGFAGAMLRRRRKNAQAMV